MKSFGKLSHGVRLGWQAGFDSGVMLDYVYRNKAAGTSPLGWMIDKFFLRAIGWRGIRQRRENLQRLLLVAIEHHRRENRPVHIVDIAAGAGRYVLETLAKLNDDSITAHLRDYQNIEAPAALAAELKLKNVTTEIGDAFDWEELASLTPKPTIAIASGIYELFADNAPIRRSLDGLAAAMDPGTLLIYTCQPWHPELEMIARTLTNHQGKPWIMRRRTQAEMDALVRAAGFEKVDQDIDQWGIFTASLARRV